MTSASQAANAPDAAGCRFVAKPSDCKLSVVDGFGGVDLAGASIDPGAHSISVHRQGPMTMRLQAVMPAAEAGEIRQDR